MPSNDKRDPTHPPTLPTLLFLFLNLPSLSPSHLPSRPPLQVTAAPSTSARAATAAATSSIWGSAATGATTLSASHAHSSSSLLLPFAAARRALHAAPPALAGGGRGGGGSGGAAAKAAGLKTYRPTTPGLRGRVTTDRAGLWAGPPLKALVGGVSKTGGRGHGGQVSVRHRGGGARKVYRSVSFMRLPAQPVGAAEAWAAATAAGGRGGVEAALSAPALAATSSSLSPPPAAPAAHAALSEGVLVRIEYDPNRSARIGLVRLKTEAEAGQGTREWAAAAAAEPPGGPGAADKWIYVLAPAGLAPGDVLAAGPGAPVKPGNTLPLYAIPPGTPIHGVELLPGRGAQLARAAGVAATLVTAGGAGGYATVRLPSGSTRRVLARCAATVGALGNAAHANRKLGKAGAARWAGRRPKVRGVAMNSVDHPMGGGRGKSKGRISQSPTGVPAKGKKTRAKRSRTDQFIKAVRGGGGGGGGR